ncbi:hypothetical protein NCG97_01505 [Streptomyces lydicamycinicus]|uniref:hypothetical protein n=1 Tax=Streptomyces lydicamycinicus TaxID=1546107 RepID=UPI0020365F9F|nr:hypothetical protein [Streptomyces lydicamycinicus]URZ99641.1 hypothetical protein NCG97_01505 [Streptomyces lydicamycinicus]
MTDAGRLAYLPVPVSVDQKFADRLEASGRPESRYRFTEPCAEGGCPQWTGSACDVIDHLLDEPDEAERARLRLATADEDRSLPTCGIRRDCRWFSQRGAAACAACPAVVADVGGTATYRSIHNRGAATSL